ncbi:MAG: DUF58 domain-containing protein [Deltaproteobacteria bacterium]|nr:DUF58 domain-containing protein [Deltaproteobacteria bacterium]
MLSSTLTPSVLRQLEMLKLNARRAFLGTRQGGHLSIKRGHGIEFSDYRKYELGDHPRYIDWGVYARSDKLYVKRFQEEQDLPVLILLDTSASMATPEEEGKWQRACDVVLALAYISLMQQDAVTVAALGRFITPRLTGASSIHHLSRMLKELEPQGQVDIAPAVHQAVSRIRFPGVAIMVSDFLMDVAVIRESFNFMRAKNLDITALQLLGPSDYMPFDESASIVAVDSETGQEMGLSSSAAARERYASLLSRHLKEVAGYFSEARVQYSVADCTKDFSQYIAQDLAATGLLQ